MDGKRAPDRRRAVPDPADRLRRRGRLRDPLPERPRRVPVGRAHRGGQAARPDAVRPRAPAPPAPAEDAHPHRAGHRLRVDAVRGRDAVDRQARQGGGLHRQVGAEHYAERRARDRARRLHDGQRARADRGRGRRAQRRGRRAGDERRAARRSSARSSASRGCRRTSPPTTPRSRSPTRARPTTPTVRRSRSTTPRGRCCARERCSTFLGARRRPRRRRGSRPSRRARADGARRAAAGARFEVRDGWNVAVGYASAEREREACRETAGWADASHLGKLELHATSRRRPRVDRRRGGRRRDARALTATRAADAWWLPLTAGRALVVCEPAALGLRERLEDAASAAPGRSASSTRPASTRP